MTWFNSFLPQSRMRIKNAYRDDDWSLNLPDDVHRHLSMHLVMLSLFWMCEMHHAKGLWYLVDCAFAHRVHYRQYYSSNADEIWADLATIKPNKKRIANFNQSIKRLRKTGRNHFLPYSRKTLTYRHVGRVIERNDHVWNACMYICVSNH